jgi:hypothetical protein
MSTKTTSSLHTQPQKIPILPTKNKTAKSNFENYNNRDYNTVNIIVIFKRMQPQPTQPSALPLPEDSPSE